MNQGKRRASGKQSESKVLFICSMEGIGGCCLFSLRHSIIGTFKEITLIREARGVGSTT